MVPMLRAKIGHPTKYSVLLEALLQRDSRISARTSPLGAPSEIGPICLRCNHLTHHYIWLRKPLSFNSRRKRIPATRTLLQVAYATSPAPISVGCIPSSREAEVAKLAEVIK